jgi:16S rRNA processing protein RimM
VLEGRVHRGNLIVARLLGIEDRDQAGELGGSEIAVSRAQFEPLRDGQYYWTDLLGLEVRNLAGIVFGTIVGMMETGANDVMEVKQEDGQARLIPFVLGLYVKEVRLDDGLVIVDWDPDF